MVGSVLAFSIALLGSTLGLSPRHADYISHLEGFAARVPGGPGLFSDYGIGHVGPLQPQLLRQEEDPEDPEDPEDSETRIQKGRVSQKVPSFVAGLVYYRNDRNGNEEYKGPFCTSTLISSTEILTAAHCTEGMKNVRMEVVLGLSDLRAYSMRINENNPNVAIRDFYFEDVEHHENYTGKEDNFLNDIAIIKLSEPVDISQFKPIQLAGKEEGYTQNLKANGWGLKNCWSSSAEALREANGTFVDRPTCSDKWSRARDSTPIPKSQVCVTYKADGMDAAVASGDSGGPVYSDASNGPVQIGIASHVIFDFYYPPFLMCVDSSVPQVYNSVPEYKDWILKHSPSATFV